MELSPSSSLSSSPASSPSSSPPHSDHPEAPTVTQLEQLRVEQMVAEIYHVLCRAPPHERPLVLELLRASHIEFLKRGLRQLGPSYNVLDANRPWLCYWIIHSLALLDAVIDSELEGNVIDFLSRCQDRYGGYCGGPGQMPHLATTYAAVNTLVTLGSERALSSINRDKMYNFLLRMKDSSGAFRMHDGGEIDVRACYTAVSVATILNIVDSELVKDVGSYILSCQTYEGGIAGEPGSEAHGGYTFCGLATMILINEVDRLDLPSLLDWVAFRQGVECGFQGRTNKLVDGCYSFWQGGVLALMQRLLTNVGKQLKTSFLSGQPSVESLCADMGDGTGTDDKSFQAAETSYLANYGIHPSSAGKLPDFGSAFIKTQIEGGPLFNTLALQQYILLCSQVREGGFRDKPGKFRDHYHSCYCLSGLSISQFSFSKDVDERPPPSAVLGSFSNLLQPIHPLHNVVLDQYYRAHEFFSRSTFSE